MIFGPVMLPAFFVWKVSCINKLFRVSPLRNFNFYNILKRFTQRPQRSAEGAKKNVLDMLMC